MPSARAGLGITLDAFNPLVEDLVAALDGHRGSPGAQRMRLGALTPMASDIVTA